ncbi:hypothetical protein L914_02085 [Phytophthora nicotianae]|uniref:Uncharacterized protein n=1 Tax=Phytophthora nicotianae TaxID=4792 RepID=W2P1M8_PHYNI|nr:hypothetical protein L914_02085 [Phytophthora nicotianae]
MSPETGSSHIPSISPLLPEANCHFTTEPNRVGKNNKHGVCERVRRAAKERLGSKASTGRSKEASREGILQKRQASFFFNRS